MTPTPSDELWSAIADPSRRRILDLLVAEGASSASTLAGQVPFTRQAVAKHLGVLEDAGLVHRTRIGKEVVFDVEPARLAVARDALSQVARTWDRRLATIKSLAEEAHRRAGGSDPVRP